MGIDPVTHRPRTDINILANLPHLLAAANFSNLVNIPLDINAFRLQSDATQLAEIHLLHNILLLGTSSGNTPPTMEAMNLLGGPTLRENQLYELLGINSQLEGNTSNLPFGFAPHELITQLQSNFLNLEASQHQPQFSKYHQPMKNSKICSNSNDQFACSSSSAVIPTSTPQLPALVPASPERRPTTVNKTENKINPNDISNHSSTSTTFEAWGDLMDDEASDSYWRDIIE